MNWTIKQIGDSYEFYDGTGNLRAKFFNARNLADYFAFVCQELDTLHAELDVIRPGVVIQRMEERYAMTRTEFNDLGVGDVIRHRGQANGYIVTAHYGDRVTAVRTMDVCNPEEWFLVSKANREAEADPLTEIRSRKDGWG